jgi:hypothetical protein
MALSFRARLMALHLLRPFQLAHGTSTLRKNVLLEISDETHNDPFRGATMQGGRITLPEGPGLGVIEREQSVG